MAKQTFTVGQVLTAAQVTNLQQTAMLGGSATAKTASYTLVAADAGTVVAVNSTSATTITVNTGLFSAGDIVTIQNWGSGSVTITAGTATVNTAGSLIVPQYDGGILYFTSASAAIYFDWVQAGATSPLTTKGDIWVYGSSDTRLGVGTDGQYLTADSTQSTGLKWAAGGSSLVGCSLYGTGTVSTANNTTQALTYNAEYFDTDNFHSTSSNTSRITIPTGKSGKYHIFALVTGDGGLSYLYQGEIRKNGTATAQMYYVGRGTSSPNIVGCINMAGVLELSAGDYIEFFINQNSGGSLAHYVNVGAQFTAIYIGA